MIKRIISVFLTRNKEFLRDKSAFVWNLLFPFLIVLGFYFMFSGRSENLYQIGLIGDRARASAEAKQFLETKHLKFVDYESLTKALEKVSRHQLDLVLDLSADRYWINSTSPKGYIVEKLLHVSGPSAIKRQLVSGNEIRYVDWLLPGILAMNMMFSCLFGVGFVIVRYRKNGVLKRMSATPITAFEFLSAQIFSRFVLILFVTAVVFVGCKYSIGFEMRGRYIDLFVVFTLGALSLISLGILTSCRTDSEEFAGGLLNVVTWPMMFLSGVWFSLEGSPKVFTTLSQLFPLTPLIDSARKIMSEGKGLADLTYPLLLMSGMTVLFLFAGSVLFRWDSSEK